MGLVVVACTGQGGEKEAAARYSAAAANVRPLQRAFTDAFEAVQKKESRDANELRDVGRTRVLPALRAYVAALDALPSCSAELDALHGRLREAWTIFQRRVEDYFENVDEKNLPRRNAQLRSSHEDLAARVVQYGKELNAYYKKVGMMGDGGEPHR